MHFSSFKVRAVAGRYSSKACRTAASWATQSTMIAVSSAKGKTWSGPTISTSIHMRATVAHAKILPLSGHSCGMPVATRKPGVQRPSGRPTYVHDGYYIAWMTFFTPGATRMATSPWVTNFLSRDGNAALKSKRTTAGDRRNVMRSLLCGGMGRCASAGL